MLKAAVSDSLQQLWLKHELLEASSMNANISLLLLSSLSSGRLRLNNLLLLLQMWEEGRQEGWEEEVWARAKGQTDARNRAALPQQRLRPLYDIKD